MIQRQLIRPTGRRVLLGSASPLALIAAVSLNDLFKVDQVPNRSGDLIEMLADDFDRPVPPGPAPSRQQDEGEPDIEGAVGRAAEVPQGDARLGYQDLIGSERVEHPDEGKVSYDDDITDEDTIDDAEATEKQGTTPIDDTPADERTGEKHEPSHPRSDDDDFETFTDQSEPPAGDDEKVIDFGRIKAKRSKAPPPPPDEKEDVNEAKRRAAASDSRDLAEMNAIYAVVKVGGKTRVMSLEESPIYLGCKVPVFSTVQDFCLFHLKHKKSIYDAGGREKKIDGIGRRWINHAERRQYDGIVYAPGIAQGGMFNLWTGFSCSPQEGDCDLYLKHLQENICSGNDAHYRYLIDWMAYSAQFPDRQGEVAVALRGTEGTGKGIAVKQYGHLFGPHFRHVVQAKHLIGHFNAHLQQCSVLFADEAFFAGDRAHESILKALITEETLLIEPKGVDPFPVRNCIHLIMSSNSDWVIPAGADARRFFVLNVSGACKQDRRYFGAIVQQMENGGREALLFHLLHRDLSNFNVGHVPQTGALAEQKAHTRRGIDRLIEQIAHDGRLPSAHLHHLDVAVTTGEEDNKGFYFHARILVPDLRHDSSIEIANKLKEWNCQPWKSGNQRGIRFPPLSDLRERFDAKHGPQSWPPAEDGEPVEWDGV